MNSASGYQRVNGLRLYVHRHRDPEAQPSGLTVLLVHGFLDAGATWDMVVPALAKAGHDVVAPDLRGFGQSDWVGPGGYYHFPDYVADLAEIVDAMNPRRLAVVGHSMGGTVAALYAGSAKPGTVERLALLEGMGPPASPPSIAIDRMQAWLRSMREISRTPKVLDSIKEAVERLSGHHPGVSREVLETRAKLLTRGDDQGRLTWAYDPMHRTTAPTPFNVEGFREFLGRIDCPVLVVSGGPKGWHPPDEAERIGHLKHPLLTEIPNAGHMMHWTEPQALVDRLLGFFAEPVQKLRSRTVPGKPAQAAAAPRVDPTVPPVSSPVSSGAPTSPARTEPSSPPHHAPTPQPPAYGAGPAGGPSAPAPAARPGSSPSPYDGRPPVPAGPTAAPLSPHPFAHMASTQAMPGGGGGAPMSPGHNVGVAGAPPAPPLPEPSWAGTPGSLQQPSPQPPPVDAGQAARPQAPSMPTGPMSVSDRETMTNEVPNPQPGRPKGVIPPTRIG